MKELNTFKQFLAEGQINEEKDPIGIAANLSAYYGKNLDMSKVEASQTFLDLPGNTEEEKFDYLTQTINYHEGEGAQKLKAKLDALVNDPTFKFFSELDKSHKYFSGGNGGGSFDNVLNRVSSLKEEEQTNEL